MSTAYPANFDTFQNPLAVDLLSNPSHAKQHSDANDAIEIIEREIGKTGDTSLATLRGQIAAKADVAHNHDTQYAGIVHAHTIADVSGLQTQLTTIGSDISALEVLVASKADNSKFTISSVPPTAGDGVDGDWWAVV